MQNEPLLFQLKSRYEARIFCFVFKACMSTASGQDTDCDGLIDNSGFADQTFDCWVVTGARYVLCLFYPCA